ncbi:hypothetical protein PTTG_25541 [Puccinia triticina 1-1 BBBD Race 1]|uniref:Uncharacterized protein n=1 Tax=Puccinia triticina (isolate 1-1 / race 1 (BBBD)) TaxID=630390 RepID=A0A180H260_PUCT1|nr:hypothetical protein PTTG_25541 [Puccinia triticina 1-1 BBBD Race 1]
MSISQLDPSLLESPSGIHQSPNLSDLHINSDYSSVSLSRDPMAVQTRSAASAPEPASGKPKRAR